MIDHRGGNTGPSESDRRGRGDVDGFLAKLGRERVGGRGGRTKVRALAETDLDLN